MGIKCINITSDEDDYFKWIINLYLWVSSQVRAKSIRWKRQDKGKKTRLNSKMHLGAFPSSIFFNVFICVQLS